jgi:YHS domain-containing protein
MIILRFVVLIILLYIGWVLLKNILGLKKKEVKQSDSTGSGNVQDVLVEDPVCHTLVPKNQAIRLRQGDTTHYFCSEKCYNTFIEQSRGSE